MARSRQTSMSVQAQLRTAVATAQVVRFTDTGSTEARLETGDWYRVEMCVTPRPQGSRE